MKKTVVGLGEVLWDMLPDGRQIGGAPANFAFHAGQWDHRAYVVSAVGADPLGEETQRLLQAKGLNTMIPHTPYPTGTVAVTLTEGGIPHYDICQGVAWDHIPFTPAMEELATHTDAVCFGSLAQRSAESRSTIYRFVDTMPDTEDTLKVFDINLRQTYYSAEVIEQSLTRCNIIKLNDEELPVVTRLFALRGGSAEAQCQALISRFGLRLVILTCGTMGSYVYGAGTASFVATPRVQVADTVGAGDSFTGSFVAALLNGQTVGQAHQLAVKVSAYVCSQHGAMPEVQGRV